MSKFEIISTILAAIGIFATIYNLQLFVRASRADHERRRKQATIEYAGQLLREARMKIDVRYRFQALTSEDINKVMSNPEEEAELRNILGVFEHLAVGVHAGVYDRDILYRMSATYIISIFQRVKAYIDVAREKFSPNAFTEFERLATEFKSRKENAISVKGDIEYS